MNLTMRRFNERPRTKLGWWAIWLAMIFVIMFIANVVVFSLISDETFWRGTILPFYGPIMLLCGVAGGVVGLLAVFRKHEHSLLIWLAIFMGVFVVVITLNEFLQLLQYLGWI